MNIKRIGIILLIALFIFGCKPEEESKNSSENGNDTTTGTNPETVYLTVGGSKDLTAMLNAGMSDKTITWSSGNSSKVAVSSNGIITSSITSFTAAEGGSKNYTDSPAKSEVLITAKALDGKTQTFNVIATTEAQEDVMDLPPLKDRFPPNILVGNIASGSVSSNKRLIRHFNALTAENLMKPSAISSSQGSYNYTSADSFVDSAITSGFKVIGHTLLWHSQIPTWQTNMASAGKDVALAAMKQYITDVVTHFKGKIYSWDVLNEAFPDSGTTSDWKTSIRTANPWFKSIGSDFVYEGFLAARLADPDAILYYNDYNTDNSVRATLIRNMVREVNQKYLASDDKPVGEDTDRLLIEGIGMQEHHNTGVSAANIRNTLTMFKALTGIKVSITELDVLAQSWNEYSNKAVVTNNGLLTQASLYQQYMNVYKDFFDIIERISFWGVIDSQSWRSAGLPLLFDKNGKAKPAYYKFVSAIPATW